MQEKPLLIPLASLIAGLCLAHLLGSTPPFWAPCALLLTTLAACFVQALFPYLLSLSLLFLVWGGVALAPFLDPADELARHASELPVVIEGVVAERPKGVAGGGARLLVRVERLHGSSGETAVSGRLLVTVKAGSQRLATGDRVLFCSKIRRPRNYGLPGEVDYVRGLAYQGVFATAFVPRADDLVLLRAGSGWRNRIDLLAATLGNFIDLHTGGVEGGVLKALLLGERGGIPRELQDAYSRSGVSHILSISGFHVGIIFLCVYQGLFCALRRFEFPALRCDLRKALMIAALPVVLLYLFLSGAAPATVRSVLMIAALVAALSLKRELDPVNSIMVAAGIILFTAPQALFDLSFQLSFLAIWGLVVLAPALPATPGVPLPWRWLLLLLAASSAAILATLVPVAYYFHQVAFIGLAANLVIVPLMGYGAVVAGFVSLPLSFAAPLVSGALLACAAFMVRLSDQVIVFLARAPLLTSYAPTAVDLVLAVLVLCALTFARPKKIGAGVACLLSVLLVVRAVPATGSADGLLRVHFLSVGQGDAALARLPDGKWLMVDGGGRAGDAEEHVGRRLLLPALNRLGVRRIDYLVLSHEHPDHLQGVLFLAETFDVGEVWMSSLPAVSREHQTLNWVLSARAIPVRHMGASSAPFGAGGAVVEPLWPATSLPPADPNDASLVFRLRHGESSVLFTGDLGTRSEKEILKGGRPLQSSILKVAHHGSKYASCDSFLEAVRPAVAVISAGWGNPFKLPSSRTVTALASHGIRVYRTDLDGTVEAICAPDGSIKVSTPWGAF